MTNNFIKIQRITIDKSQQQMADSLKITQQGYSLKESGINPFTASEFMVMANMFNVNISKLIMGGKRK